jgi:hypothetical protein
MNAVAIRCIANLPWLAVFFRSRRRGGFVILLGQLHPERDASNDSLLRFGARCFCRNRYQMAAKLPVSGTLIVRESAPASSRSV